MNGLPPVTGENADLARLVFGAYQARCDKPVGVEHGKKGDGTPYEEVFGMINPCRFGDQCEGHACYCNHPDGPRKCRKSWYYGGEERDQDCEYYEPNPHWQEAESGDYYEGRTRTLAHMREQGLVEDREEAE